MMTLACALLIALQDPADAKIKELVSQLASDEIETREAAEKALADLGEPALATLKKLMGSESDAEVKARIKTVVEQIGKKMARARVYRPAKTVTLAAREKPVAEIVKSACDQAGVPFEVAARAGERTASIQADQKPLMQALDMLCTPASGLVWSIDDGKIKVDCGAAVARPAAYGDAFRLRVRRVMTYHVNDFDAAAASIVIYLNVDCEPGVKPHAIVFGSELKGSDGKREVAFKPTLLGQMTGSASLGDHGDVVVDDILIRWDSETPVDRSCFLKEAPVDLKRLDALRAKVTMRFSAGTRTLTCKPTGNGHEVKLGDLPLEVTFEGTDILISDAAHRFGRIGGLVDLDSACVVTQDGKEHKCGIKQNLPGFAWLTSDVKLEPGDGGELRLSAFDDIFEREVEFELRDIKLRD